MFLRFRRWLWMGLGYAPVTILWIEVHKAEDDDPNQEHFCRVQYLIAPWATDEDVAVARSQVPLHLKQVLGCRIKITRTEESYEEGNGSNRGRG